MPAQLLDGRALAARLRPELAAEIAAFARTHGFPPGLAVVQVGADPASRSYSRQIARACAAVGIAHRALDLPAGSDRAALAAALEPLAADPRVFGLLVQMPVPPPLAATDVARLIPPTKDVDGISPVNAGWLAQGVEGALAPSTPLGGLELLRAYDLATAGRHVVVVGRSSVVGRPLALLLLRRAHDSDVAGREATVTICHSRTPDLAAHTRRADILLVAAGQAGLIAADMVRPGAVVVDFGTNATESGLVGDVDFAGVSQVASWITPVPGGTGPLTVVMLLRNTLAAARAALGG